MIAALDPLVGVVLIVGVLTWVAVRRRYLIQPDGALVAGVVLVVLAAEMRRPYVPELLGVERTGVEELVKHVLLVAGCLCLATYVPALNRGRRVDYVRLAITVVVGVAVLVVCFWLNGPWEPIDLTLQAGGRWGMIPYWTVLYGSVVLAAARFVHACLRGRRYVPRRRRWGADTAIVGACLAVLWALLSALQVNSSWTLPAVTPEFDAALDLLVVFSTGLVVVGIGGHLAHGALERRANRTQLARFHGRLMELVPEARLAAPGTRVADYHRDVEISDVLSSLRRHSSRADRHSLRRVAPWSVSARRMLRVELAADRRMEDLVPGDPERWRWAANDRALAKAGRYLGSARYPQALERVLAPAPDLDPELGSDPDRSPPSDGGA
ncbi:hypothetical protein GCM10025865_11340 [Paraoerskovia sediminicola]|uniref:Uncharacterized protein n=1 Tax=Paraoerskovia sediminicola TaxID=1138587 RepID=A0ABM8G167_9CELL|nr:hypothetical protein GCM10025865_11340 [Paraoerskovia sediminicola]